MRLLLCLLALLACIARAEPLRVISLAPSMTEIMLELQADGLLVGVLDGGERPAALQALPSVGRQGQLDLERLVSLRPDLLLLWPGSIAPAQREQLTRLGIATYSAEPHTLAQLIDQIDTLAQRLGLAERGQVYASGLRQRLRQLRERYHREQPLRVFYQVWDRPLYTLGGRQVVSDALAVCGARNIFDDLNQPAPQVSVESVLLRNPQVILAGDAAQLQSWHAWSAIDAVAQGRLLVIPDKGIERPSGQMIEATARLCAMLAAKAPVSR
ncbi:cobalamin-binding protein [Pseudomonas putida]|uniref:cobalamin-binding protein n=1 Tax=Pseudomonas TaxID=286 RepID=UPI001059BE31|nr:MULTISPECIES: cobalamin-binding protein [Pseudomonas]MBF8747733.1 cobalamin-binding protein [Pseudomonas monteilii]MCT8164524.1 cobalamin-binding protein [Pseudomonas sp. HD6422]MCT8183295.1 cobalamin-binding protein [Pseudomonas sp. HD6421]TDJ75028.1 cobalamin-binding protein [Pseudomonas putida]